MNGHLPDEHRVWTTKNIRHASGPAHGSRILSRITSSPDTKLQLRRCLRILVVAFVSRRVCVVEGADHFAINFPVGVCFTPFDTVFVKSLLWAGDVKPGATVIITSQPFATRIHTMVSLRAVQYDEDESESHLTQSSCFGLYRLQMRGYQSCCQKTRSLMDCQ